MEFFVYVYNDFFGVNDDFNWFVWQFKVYCGGVIYLDFFVNVFVVFYVDFDWNWYFEVVGIVYCECEVVSIFCLCNFENGDVVVWYFCCVELFVEELVQVVFIDFFRDFNKVFVVIVGIVIFFKNCVEDLFKFLIIY